MLDCLTRRLSEEHYTSDILSMQKSLTRLRLVDVPGYRANGDLHDASQEVIENYLANQRTL